MDLEGGWLLPMLLKLNEFSVDANDDEDWFANWNCNDDGEIWGDCGEDEGDVDDDDALLLLVTFLLLLWFSSDVGGEEVMMISHFRVPLSRSLGWWWIGGGCEWEFNVEWMSRWFIELLNNWSSNNRCEAEGDDWEWDLFSSSFDFSSSINRKEEQLWEMNGCLNGEWKEKSQFYKLYFYWHSTFSDIFRLFSSMT